MSKNRIIPQMYDVRPVDKTGDLDWQKISAVGSEGKKISTLNKENEMEKENHGLSANAYYLGIPIRSEQAPIFHDSEFNLRDIGVESPDHFQLHENFHKKEAEMPRQQAIWQQHQVEKEQEELQRQEIQIKEERKAREIRAHLVRIAQHQKTIALQELEQKKQQAAAELAETKQREIEKMRWLEMEKLAYLKSQNVLEALEKNKQSEAAKKPRLKEKSSILKSLKLAKKRKSLQFDQQKFSLADIFLAYRYDFQFQWRKFVPAFALIALVLFLGIGGISFASKGFGMQGKVLGVSQDGFANLTNAIENMKAQNFDGSAEQFSQAFENFSQASRDLEELGGGLLDATRFLPFATKVASGKNAVEAGKHFSAAGQSLNQVVKTFAQYKQFNGQTIQGSVSLLEIFKTTENNVIAAKKELDEAQKNIDIIAIDDLPTDKQQKFLLLKEKLPQLRSMMEIFLSSSHIFVELLGGNGPRKYLFLFQNNSEMRATGGFIGSYGLLDIANGHVKKFFIDGIFNPDGQLKDKIVPPEPIQKVSAAWSLHDSNWFPDFPMSAQKAIGFYERTGGPTADGVISLTPTLMQKLLKLTGPIEMPEYDVTLDSENFIQLTQFKVEVDYDKQDNKPKKILSDLAPLVLEKLLNSKSLETVSGAQQAIIEGLNEKHILLYSQNNELEDIISSLGWSGKIISTGKDYLSVINTNINGFKTDAVVDEYISHNAQIQDDGTIIDTVKITRKHTGGNSQYEWLNKVNADYMRVYVPRGSKLLEVSGQTRELDQPPLDYAALGFKRDSDVVQEETGIVVDPASGTRVYDENDKTVFANWVYVSPQETVNVTYKYVLPFRLFQLNVGNSKKVDSYSLVAQKQSGSIGSSLTSSINYSKKYTAKWTFPQGMTNKNNELKNNANLVTDYFEGVVFESINP
ncbi:MAG: DUF4012 domain-containing protein [Candidatus Moraniibacteriota bacterium]